MQRNAVCNESRLDAFLANSLSSGERREVRAHLVKCGWCRDYYDFAREQSAAREAPSEAIRIVRDVAARGAIVDRDGLALLDWALAQPASEWASIAAAHRELRTPDVVRRLLDLIQQHERNLAVRTLELATFAVDIVDMLQDSEEVERLRCAVWRKLSTANYGRGDYLEALRALDLAESHVGYWPDGDLEAAVVQNARVPILRRIGRPAAARAALDSAIDVFRRYDSKGHLAQALYNDASLRYESSSWPEAEALFAECAEQMRFVGDAEMHAAAVFGIGHCRANRGDSAGAIEAWAKASVLFDRCGMRADRNRLTQAIGRMKIRSGDHDGGLSDLREAERAFADLAMGGDAIDAGLEIVETLVALNESWDEIVDRCRRMVPRAQAAGLTMQSAVALSHLRQAAREQKLTVDFVRRVRRFVRDSPAYPSVEFEVATYLSAGG